MTNFQYIIDEYKENARQNNVNPKDVIIYGIARAFRYSESDGETNYLAGKYVLRAFVPVTNKNRLEFQLNGDCYRTLKQYLYDIARGWYGDLYKQCDEATQEDIKSMALHLIDVLHRNYVYIVVREDLEIPEQCVVQAAHATFVAGHKIRADHLAGKFRLENFDPNYTHFVVCGAKDLNELEMEYERVVNDGGFVAYPFYEGDIGGQMTAFATQPVQQGQRGFFKQYQLLKFNREDQKNGYSN
jgi:hypothetical protein